MSRNKKGGPFQNWLVVEPTHLKNMSEIGMNIDQILELPPARISEKKTCLPTVSMFSGDIP